ncbi:MAG: hypothetical protein Q7V58_03970 [Actinomycetota bacterium]|nr:hypothetical protein [Actinomycetota bacterium]
MIRRSLLAVTVLAMALLFAPQAQAARDVTATLAISASTAAVRVEVPMTITVRPASVASTNDPRGRVVRVQVLDRQGHWVTIDSYRLPRSGIVQDTVTGIEEGFGRYRVLVMSIDRRSVIARSNVDTVTWTAPAE